jgi:molybdenum cofactor cytidylyltransferase
MSDSRKEGGVSAVVLAAGMSRRMGTPKQLLRIGGETILEHTLKNVRASDVDEVILVLGFAAESMKKEISTERLKVVHNPDYQQGMGTSLRTGLAAVDARASAALIVLADQPFVRPETIDKLIARHHERRPQNIIPQIIIPMYRGFRGNPVLLDRSVFSELKELSGDVGCRAIFGSHAENICKLAVDDVGILLDIDSREEYQKLEEAYAAKRHEPRRPAAAAVESREDLPVGRADLVVAGRDAVAQALAKFGRLLNFTVTMVDPLIALADQPDADRVLRVLDFSLLPPAGERYVVVATRGQFDEEAVEQALRMEASYIALLANKKRAEEIMRTLRAKSYSPERLAGIRAPAGLDIGAETPEEIALSIMAEIVVARRQREKDKL